MTDAAADISDLSFEQALGELEKIVSELESGQAPLERSIDIYLNRLKGDVWTVAGTLRCFPRCKGGTAEVKISKQDARIVSITHSK